jgi:polyhydroxyalkanoate synthesis regulator phasin
MAITTDQYTALLSRLTKIERTINDLITAQGNLVSALQVNEVFTVLQTDIISLTSDVEALTSRVETIENEPYDENG